MPGTVLSILLIKSFKFTQQSNKLVLITIIPTIQMKELRLEDAKSFSQGPKAGEAQIQDMKPVPSFTARVQLQCHAVRHLL